MKQTTTDFIYYFIIGLLGFLLGFLLMVLLIEMGVVLA